MFTNFKQKVQNVCHTMLGVTFCVFFGLVATQTCLLIPRSPWLYDVIFEIQIQNSNFGCQNYLSAISFLA